jgi:hypothetical protein
MIDHSNAGRHSNRLKKFPGEVARFWETDREQWKYFLNSSADFPSSWITRCILRWIEPIKLLISPMFKFFHSFLRIWMSFTLSLWFSNHPSLTIPCELLLRVVDWTTSWPIKFFKRLTDPLDQEPTLTAALGDPLNRSDCHNVSEDFWSLAIILVVNFATKGLMIVQRAFTKSSDERRKSGHKKTKRRRTKENEE